MVSQVFKNLPASKQKAVIDACIDEFAEFGFDQASTNRIVNKLGIAKGSLFKYFGNKEDIYFFLIEQVLNEFLAEMDRRKDTLSRDLFTRMWEILDIAFELYLESSRYLRFFMILTDNSNQALMARYIRSYGMDSPAVQYFYRIMMGVDEGGLRLGLESSFRVVSWMMAGIKMELNKDFNAETNIPELRERYRKSMELGFDALKHGMLKK
ncbi:MAG: hypothetical protein A2Y33_13155 [Spirochaetes bacterium GWF1_51_8]|nr:MAG: hypothetical protein A2Y33_13155 [Spirochaetes bacterium GWF1_51_8]